MELPAHRVLPGHRAPHVAQVAPHLNSCPPGLARPLLPGLLPGRLLLLVLVQEGPLSQPLPLPLQSRAVVIWTARRG